MAKQSSKENDTIKDSLGKDVNELEDVESDIAESYEAVNMEDVESDIAESDVEAVNMTEGHGYGADKLSELKKAIDIKLSSDFNISKKITDIIFAYANVHPDIAREATEIALQDHSIIYLDYYQKLNMLNDQLGDRMLDASNEALQRCLRAREKAIPRRTEQNRQTMKMAEKTTPRRTEQNRQTMKMAEKTTSKTNRKKKH
jgi:hypothetical protein